MVQDFLKMFIEVLNCITIIVRGRGVGLYNCDVNGLALRRIVIRLLESGRQLMTVFTMPLWTRNPTPCSCLSSLPLKYNLRPPWVDILPKFFHRTSQRPKMFQRYLVVSCLFFQFACYSQGSQVPGTNNDIISGKYFACCYTSRILLTSVVVRSGGRGPCWPGRRPI